MYIAEILSQGDEVITGQTVDTNASWLSQQLTELGFVVRYRVTVGDRLDDIVASITRASTRADVVISTGGLGPTDDDLTNAAVADAVGQPLELDEEALALIRAMYTRYGRVMPEVNARQALLPRGCDRLDNAWGTAPGFAVERERAWMAFLPGVPREMRKIFTHEVLPRLQERFAVRPGQLVTLRTTGIGESNLQERIGAFERAGMVLGYRTMLPENHVKLRIEPDVSDAEVREVVAELRAAIGSPVFAVEGLGEPGGSLSEVVARALAERGETLAVSESCTGGRVAAMCTAIPGSSRWFIEGCVTYCNDAKQRRLGVRAETLAEVGAVSELVARQMAEGIRASAGTTYGLSTTGIAGPGGGHDAKPVGTVHIGLATPTGTVHRKLQLGGSRTRIQDLSAAAVIDLLRRHLQGVLPA